MTAAAAGKGKKRKRAAKEKGGAESPQRDLEAKKRHVRELAMEGRWQEIKRRYGSKMMDKAKTYAEKQRAKHTPQSLARDILLKNGYIAPDTRIQRDDPTIPSSSTAPLPNARADHSNQGNGTSQQGSSRLPMPPARQRSPPQLARVSVSPETLTEDQLQLIEQRRREALERRRRKDALAACAAASSGQQEVCHALPTLPTPAHAQRAPDTLRTDGPIGGDMQWGNSASGTVRGYSTGATLATGLTIAGHYVHELDDDNSHLVPDMASQEARTIEESEVTGASREGLAGAHQQVVQAPPAVSISQELAAAADIVMWEQENEALEGRANQPPVSVISVSDDDDPDLPRFKLLPSPEEPIQPYRLAETAQAASWAGAAPVDFGCMAPAVSMGAVDIQQEPIAPTQPTPNRKRTRQGQSNHDAVAAAQRPKPSNNHTTVNHEERAQQATSASEGPSNRHDAVPENRDPREENAVEKLIEKHLLDNALDTILLQFIDMILS